MHHHHRNHIKHSCPGLPSAPRCRSRDRADFLLGSAKIDTGFSEKPEFPKRLSARFVTGRKVASPHSPSAINFFDNKWKKKKQSERALSVESVGEAWLQTEQRALPMQQSCDYLSATRSLARREPRRFSRNRDGTVMDLHAAPRRLIESQSSGALR